MEKFERYVVEQQLGAGNYGEVFLALDSKIGRKVLIKTLNFDRFQKQNEAEAQQRRFLREIKQAGKLVHPNIVTIYDVGKTEHGFFITMEHVAGETLESILGTNERLLLPKAVSIVEQVARALDYAHNRDIIHSDISPASIVLTAPDRIKVMDFGLARYSSPEHITRAGTTIGSPSYMSPEQILGRPLDARSDIFSLGAIFYQMVVGNKPFTGKSVSSIFQKVLHTHPELNAELVSHVPQQLLKIISQAMKKDPEERFQTAHDMIVELEKVNKNVVQMFEKTTIANPGSPLKLHYQPPRSRYEKTPPHSKKSQRLRSTSTGKKVAFQTQNDKNHHASPATDQKSKLGLPDRIPDQEDGSVFQAPAATKKDAPLQRSKKSQFLLFSGFVLVAFLFILTVIFLFWGNAFFFIKFLRGNSEQPLLSPQGNDSFSHSPFEQSLSKAGSTLAAIEIASAPDGAQVYIDKQFMGRTPIRKLSLPFGLYHLEVSKEGYVTWEQDLSISESGLQKYDIPLTRAGFLSITTTPPGARISLDQKLVGDTPLEIAQLSFGEHQLILELEGFLQHEETVILSDSEPTHSVSVRLKELDTGAIRIVSETGVSVKLDEQARGSAPLLISKVPVGQHSITLSFKNKPDRTVSVTVTKNKIETVTHYFLRPGSLRVIANPFGMVYLNGVEKGVSPVVIDDIPSGRHTITIVKEGYKTARQDVSIKEASEEKIYISLEKID